MDRKSIAERLLALASNERVKRSKTASLRAVIDDVERALAAGVPRPLVVDELAAHGLEMTLATFDTTLNRIRRQREKQLSVQSGKSASTAQRKDSGAGTVPISADPVRTPEATADISHDPADLDRIIKSRPDMEALASMAKRRKT